MLSTDSENLALLWAESQRLLEHCRESNSLLDEDAVVATICRAARRVADADGACLILRERELVHYVAEDAVAPLWAGQRFPVDRCISGWSIVHRERVIIGDIYDDDRIPTELYESTFVKSLAMQPIEPPNPIGAIGVYWARPHGPDEEQLTLLEKLASVAAVLIESAALRRQLLADRLKSEIKIARKDRLLSIVSHELRAPLDALLGWVGVARSAPADPASTAYAVTIIERNAKALARLINDLLDTSLIKSGKLRIERAELSVATAVRHAIDAALPAASSKNVRVEADIDPDAGNVLADPQRLQQIFGNVLANAVKFTRPGGIVRLVASREVADAKITIADNGIGIDADFLPHVFARFRQGEANAGLGLGLAIARDLVEMHGGTIEAHSAGRGQGSTFIIRLPHRKAAARD